jgi:hypothetical protein
MASLVGVEAWAASLGGIADAGLEQRHMRVTRPQRVTNSSARKTFFGWVS